MKGEEQVTQCATRNAGTGFVVGASVSLEHVSVGQKQDNERRKEH